MDRRLFLKGAGAGVALPILHHELFAQLATGSEAAAPAPLPRPARGASGIATADLKPGEFIFEPDLSPEGPVVFIVSIPDQRVHVYRNGVEIGVSTCSTGKPGHSTPTGVFVILQKDRHHHSSTYNNAPMPNMQRLTWGGIALHAGNLPGYPASHGCIRLPRRFSELIFEITHLGIPVIIANAKSQPAQVVHPGLLLPPEAAVQAREAMLNAARKSHHPPDATKETHDVTSVVVSGEDRKTVILKDGQVEWESPIEIAEPGQPLGHHFYKLLGPASDRRSLNWLAHGIHGSTIVNTRTDQILSRIRLVKWQEAVAHFANMIPGTSLVVTDLSAGPETRSDPDFVIIRTEEDA